MDKVQLSVGKNKNKKITSGVNQNSIKTSLRQPVNVKI
jgi:hypothetical protein